MAVLLGVTAGAAWWWRQGGSGASLEVNPRDASLPVRYAIARTSAVMIKDEPLWGWGPGSFRYIAPLYLGRNPLFTDPNRQGGLRFTSSFAHSDWVQIPAEWGLAGALLFAALPMWWAGQAWRLRRVLPGESWLMLGTVALIFVGAAADFPFYCPAILIAVGIFATTALKLGEVAARPRPLLSKVMVVCP
jgi:O-antigen ligase